MYTDQIEVLFLGALRIFLGARPCLVLTRGPDYFSLFLWVIEAVHLDRSGVPDRLLRAGNDSPLERKAPYELP